MKISTKGRYALRMMIDLAQQQKAKAAIFLEILPTDRALTSNI